MDLAKPDIVTTGGLAFSRDGGDEDFGPVNMAILLAIEDILQTLINVTFPDVDADYL